MFFESFVRFLLYSSLNSINSGMIIWSNLSLPSNSETTFRTFLRARWSEKSIFHLTVEQLISEENRVRTLSSSTFSFLIAAAEIRGTIEIETQLEREPGGRVSFWLIDRGRPTLVSKKLAANERHSRPEVKAAKVKWNISNRGKIFDFLEHKSFRLPGGRF